MESVREGLGLRGRGIDGFGGCGHMGRMKGDVGSSSSGWAVKDLLVISEPCWEAGRPPTLRVLHCTRDFIVLGILFRVRRMQIGALSMGGSGYCGELLRD